MVELRTDRMILREIRLPLRERFEISSGWEEERRILLLELHHPDGPVVWSECVAGSRPNYSPETIDTARLAISEWIAPRVLGRSFTGPEAVGPALEEGVRGHPMAKAAVEMALWTQAAELQGVALARLLGAARKHVEVGISLGIQSSPEALAEKAREALDVGYRKIKLKIRPGEDYTYVAAVREAIGPGVALAVDANAAYTLADAPELTRLDRFDLMMIEQPLAHDDLRRHAELQAHLQTPICLDESIVGLASAEDMLALGSGRIINVKPGRVGGLGAARAIHDLAGERGVPVWCGGMLESGVGRAYNVALASLDNFRLPGDLSPSKRYWEQDIVLPEWTMSPDGLVTVPLNEPGLGVAIDRDRIQDLTVRVDELSAASSNTATRIAP
jgi:O-succinylbenzoate synthase